MKRDISLSFKKALRHLWAQRWVLRSLVPSLLFNFYYLPWRQAWHLPILVYRSRWVALGGEVRIDAQRVRFGMIQLGRWMAPIFPNTGVVIENRGGVIVFKGACHIGGASALSVGQGAQLVFGDDFVSNAALRVVARMGVVFGCKVRMGWECLVMDTNFHPLYDKEKACFLPASGPISIGNYNWCGAQCLVMHSVCTPERCIVAARSVLTRGAPYESFALHGLSPLRVLRRSVMRDYENDCC